METTFRCTLCPLYISNIQYFGTKEKLDDHIALHELFDLGKLRRHFFETRNTGFYCSVCYYNNPAGAHMNTYAAAIAHFDMHEQIKRESKILHKMLTCGNIMMYNISGSEIICLCCEKLNRVIEQTTNHETCHTKKIYFSSASEFFQHLMTKHLQTPPKIIHQSWKYKDMKIKAKQCSFCGGICCNGVETTDSYDTADSPTWWQTHEIKYQCKRRRRKIHSLITKEITARKSVYAFLFCYKVANDPNKKNVQSCLQLVDNHIIKTIVGFMI